MKWLSFLKMFSGSTQIGWYLLRWSEFLCILKIHMLNSNPQMWWYRRWGCWGWLVPLHERDYGDPSLVTSHEDTGRKSWLWNRSGSSPEHSHAGTLFLDFPASIAVKNTFVLIISHIVYGICHNSLKGVRHLVIKAFRLIRISAHQYEKSETISKGKRYSSAIYWIWERVMLPNLGCKVPDCLLHLKHFEDFER